MLMFKKKILSFMIIILLIMVVNLPIIRCDTLADKGIIFVDDNADIEWYDATHVRTINEGVNNASSGDTVFVYSGEYNESITVNKPLNITGESKHTTSVGNVGYEDIFYISSDNVAINNFTLENSNYDGIRIWESDFVSIHNIISKNNYRGIYCRSSSNCMIENNECYNNNVGVDIEGSSSIQIKNNIIQSNINYSFGIILVQSYENICIISNNISNTTFGLWAPSCELIEITNNIFINNSEYGIKFEEVFNCTITKNVIKENHQFGIIIEEYSNDNKIYHNNFVNNTINAVDYGENIWDNGYPSGGNYWSDFDEEIEGAYDEYNGPNQDIPDEDGFVDDPYQIGSNNQDNYPFISLLNFSLIKHQIVFVDDDYDQNTSGWQEDHFNLIQEGIDNVDNNGIIYVFNGSYSENIFIDVPVSIFGENENSTILNGNNDNFIVSLSGKAISMYNFTLANANSTQNEFGGILLNNSSMISFRNINLINNYNGFDIKSSDNISIDTCNIKYNEGNGLIIRNSGHLELLNNNISYNNLNGIYYLSENQSKNFYLKNNEIANNGINGILIRNNSLITIANNNFQNNIKIETCDSIKIFENNINPHNLKLEESLLYVNNSSNTEISKNTFSNNYNNSIFFFKSANSSIIQNEINNTKIGIKLINSSNIIIKDNAIKECLIEGINLSQFSTNNKIFHNNFINNTINAVDYGENIWDNGYPSGGNYWSDFDEEIEGAYDEYNGPNQDIPGEDEIIDTIYTISGTNYDSYPLQYKYGPVVNINTHESFFAIQESIDDIDTLNDHWIMVKNGTYYENLIIYKSINLIGEKKEKTIINGMGKGHVIFIGCDHVNISKFTITNGSDSGIKISSDYNNISQTILIENGDEGIDISYHHYNTIMNNYIEQCSVGIRSTYSTNNLFLHNTLYDTFWLHHSCNNLLINNTISANRGLDLYDSNNNTIMHNLFTLSIKYSGAELRQSSYNTFSNNTFSYNYFGLNCHQSSNYNQIYSNRFKYNILQAFDDGTNTWNKTYPSGGNIWSDYYGSDIFYGPGQNISGSDSIGDTPYIIQGGTNQDSYPKIEFSSNSPIIFISKEYTSSTPGWQYDRFSSIQAGIENVAYNGTVYVYNGTYYEHLGINKPVNLVGEDKNNTILNGENKGFVSYVHYNYVNISGFLICNSGTDGSATAGLLVNSSHNTFHNNIIRDTSYNIRINYDSQNCSIYNNELLYSNHAGGVYITGLEMNNNHAIYENIISNNMGYGIYLANTNNCTIYDNEIFNNTQYGIYLHDFTNDISIHNNTIYNNTYGGIKTDQSLKNNNNKEYKIFNNDFINNGLFLNGDSLDDYTLEIKNNMVNGLPLHYFKDNNNIILNGNESGQIFLINCTNCVIKKINLSHSDVGIQIAYGQNNTIKNCNFIDNRIGIYIASNSNNNHIYHNNFKNNSIYNAYDDCDNTWDNGYQSGGNYWSDYEGNDDNADGIGDTYYFIPGLNNIDHYPFIEPNSWDESEIDINQSIYNRGFPIRHTWDGDWGAAQNYIATLSTQTKCEIYLRKFGTPEFNLTVELRIDHPEGILLDTLSFTPEELLSSWQWLELDFDDITIEPDTDLFIVLPPAPSTVTTSFGYEWGYAFGNQYDDGSFWFTRDGGDLWRDLPTRYEFVFRTYGYN